MKRLLLIAGIFIWFPLLKAQVEQDTINVLRSVVINGDTVLLSNIPEVNIYPALQFKNR